MRGAAVLALSLVLGPPMAPTGDMTGAIRLAAFTAGPHAGDVMALDRASGRLTHTRPDGELVRAWGARGPRDGHFVEPVAVAADAHGGLWVADVGRRSLERFDGAGRFRGRVVLSGPEPPRDLVAQAHGGVLVLAGRTVLRVDPRGAVAPPLRLGFAPLAIAALPDGGLLALSVEARGGVVRRLAADGTIQASWLMAGSWSVLRPTDIAAAPDGTFLVADADRDRIVRFSAEGSGLAAWGGQGYGGGTFEPGCCFGPSSLAIAADGTVFVADDGLGLVQRFSADGAFVVEWGGTSRQLGRFNHPADVAITADGDVVVMDSDNFRVQRLAPDGTPRWSVGHFGDGPAEFGANLESGYPSQRGPTSLAVGPGRESGTHGTHGTLGSYASGDSVQPREAGEVIVVLDVWNRRIQRFGSGGAFLGAFDVPLEVPGTRDIHAVVAVAPVGAPNAGAIHLLAPESGRVLRLADDGAIEAEWSLDDAFAAPGQPRAMAMGPDGTVWLVAGSVLAGIAPDGSLVAERAMGSYDAVCVAGDPVRLAVGGGPDGEEVALVALAGCSEIIAYGLTSERLGAASIALEIVGIGLGRPMGMVVDPEGRLWFADAVDDHVRRLLGNPQDGTLRTLGASQPVGSRDVSTARDIVLGKGAWLVRSDAAADAALLDSWHADGGWRRRGRYRCFPGGGPGPRRPLDHGIGPEVRADWTESTLVLSIIDPSGPSCVLMIHDDGELTERIALTETARIVDVAAHQGDHGPPLPPHRIWLARDGLPVMVFNGISDSRLPDLPLVADALAAMPDGGLVAVLDGGNGLARVAPDGAIAQRWPSPDRAFTPHVAADAAGTMYVGAGPTVEVRDVGGALVDTWTLDAPVRGLAAGDDGRVLALVGRVLPERLVELRAASSEPLSPDTPSWLRIDRAMRHAGRWVAEWPTGGPDTPPATPPAEPDADPSSARYRLTCPPDPLSVGCSARLEGAVAAAPGDVLALAVDGGARLWLGDRLVVDAWDAARVDRTVRVPDAGAAKGEPGVAPVGDGGTALRLEVNREGDEAIEVRLAVERGGVYLPMGWR